MASTGVNVLRWSALVLGVFYGFSHQQGINSKDRSAALKHEYDRRQKLIDQAKTEFAKKNAPPESNTGAGGVVTDPMDPKFDLEAYLNQVQSQSS